MARASHQVLNRARFKAQYSMVRSLQLRRIIDWRYCCSSRSKGVCGWRTMRSMRSRDGVGRGMGLLLVALRNGCAGLGCSGAAVAREPSGVGNGFAEGGAGTMMVAYVRHSCLTARRVG